MEEADFETAISATGFGKFNIIYMIVAIPAGFGSQFESTTLSYVLPAAQCDLNLSLQDKGTLNAISYIGKRYLLLLRCLKFVRTLSSERFWNHACA